MSEDWVMLVYRVPREPSTPRIAIWRKLRKYGAYQLTDGVVLLPASARTREQLEWVAEDAVSAGGSGEVWSAAPTNPAEFERIRAELQLARGAEYAEIVVEAQQAEDHADPALLRRQPDPLGQVVQHRITDPHMSRPRGDEPDERT